MKEKQRSTHRHLKIKQLNKIKNYVIENRLLVVQQLNVMAQLFYTMICPITSLFRHRLKNYKNTKNVNLIKIISI